jgi:hypothetical protein
MKALGLDPSPFDELAKYNPYHRGSGEGAGQFTTADAAGTGAGSSGGAYSHIPAGTLIGPGQAFSDGSGKPSGATVQVAQSTVVRDLPDGTPTWPYGEQVVSFQNLPKNARQILQYRFFGLLAASCEFTCKVRPAY